MAALPMSHCSGCLAGVAAAPLIAEGAFGPSGGAWSLSRAQSGHVMACCAMPWHAAMKLPPSDLRLLLAALFVALISLLLAWRLQVTVDQLAGHTAGLTQAVAALAAIRPGVEAIPGLRADLTTLERRVAACPCTSQRQDGGDDL
jgi:hypothetical protein